MHRGNIFSLMLDFTPCYRSKTAGVDYSTSLFMWIVLPFVQLFSFMCGQHNCIVLYCLLFTAKTGCDAIKNKCHLQTLESIPKLAVGRLKKPSGYLVDTPRSSQDNKKQRKRIKQEHQIVSTKVHQYWFNRCSNLICKTIFCWLSVRNLTGTFANENETETLVLR